MWTIALRRTVVLVGTVLVVAVGGGCRGSSAGDKIDVPALERELETIIHLKLLAQGFDYKATVACVPSGSDGLHFSCRVDARNPLRPTQSWTESVTCRRRSEATAQRCVSSSGDALQ
jgi:hypothetical protein